ncbi:MAG: hypothetical protein NWQ38_01420 [Cellulophaga sp.]|nr:hypothetical protein [Cellulophaga sp.]
MNWLVPIMIGCPDNTVGNTYNAKKDDISISYSNFGDYIAGLFEGDGHIWIPKETHSPGGHKYRPNICITFHEKERPLVIRLVEF